MKLRPTTTRASVVLAVLLSTVATAARGQVRADDTLPAGSSCAEGKADLMKRLARPGAPSAASAASANFDATYYRLDLDLDFDAPRIVGVVRVAGRVVGSALTSLSLDFASDMQVDSVKTANGDPLSFTHASDVLDIAFPLAAPVGAQVAVDVYYRGLPTPGDGVVEFGERGGATFAWSYSEPYDARRWWPCKDHPSDKADSVTVIVTAPDTLQTASQGVLRSTTTPSPGRTRTEWHSGYPIATYLVSVAVGEYVEYDETYSRPPALATQYGALDLPLVHLVYDDGSSEFPASWQKTTAAMEVLESWFGPYPFPNDKYGHAEVTFGGAMEHQTMTSMGSRSTNVVAHELAHQWFGDMVSPRTWPDLWLNEGFATYSELLYWEARDADAPGTYPLLVRNTIRAATFADGTLVLSDTTSVPDMFNPTRVYAKGAVVLRMLRTIVGDSAFREILGQYAADPAVAYGTATTADFVRVAESVYGQSLDTFFRQWVTEGTGYPDYRVKAEFLEDGGHKAFVTVEQGQGLPESNVEVFEMPVTIAVLTTGGEERFTVFNDRRRQVYELELTDEPLAATFDPDMELLRDVVLETLDGPIARSPSFQEVFPNPAGTTSSLRFTLPDRRSATLELYDVAGRRVRVIDEVRGAGPHEMTVDTGGLASGVYFLRLESAAGVDHHKLVVLR